MFISAIAVPASYPKSRERNREREINKFDFAGGPTVSLERVAQSKQRIFCLFKFYLCENFFLLIA